MLKEFREGDRVSIDKNLTYTTPRFGAVSDMRSILTGTVTRNPFQNEDEVIVMLDYPDDVSEDKRIAYSYDPKDLTLISKPSHFKLNDRVKVNSLKHTIERFGIVEKMSEILTGTVDYVDERNDEVQLKLDGDDEDVYVYDPRDLTLIPNTSNNNKKKGNTMSKLNKGDRVFINKSLKHTEERFSVVSDMKSIFSGVIRNIDEDRNKATITLDVSQNNWTYDLRDLIPYNTVATPTSVKTSKDKTTVTFSDGSTTSVTKSAGDPYDLETAIAYCIAKKIVTNSCIKRLAENAEEVVDKVTTEFYNKFLKPYGFLNENAYTDVEIETLKNYLKTLNDIRSEMALIAIENNLTKDELFNKLRG